MSSRDVIVVIPLIACSPFRLGLTLVLFMLTQSPHLEAVRRLVVLFGDGESSHDGQVQGVLADCIGQELFTSPSVPQKFRILDRDTEADVIEVGNKSLESVPCWPSSTVVC